jgi:hypothetical protein
MKTAAPDIENFASRASLRVLRPDLVSGRGSLKRIKVLLLAAVYHFSYRVMRCAAEAGAEVYVLGNIERRLARSRYCKEVFVSDYIISGAYDEALAVEINWYAREFDIELVLPGDAPTTRALIAVRDLIEVPCFPMPELDQFDLLNDKWEFTKLCENIGITCPDTRLFPNVAALARELEAGGVAFPSIAKALSLNDGRASVKLDAADAQGQIGMIRYRPILVQDFIEGEDIGASVYSEGGEIRAIVAHSLKDKVYRTFVDQSIHDDIARIMAQFEAYGVFNFDMRLAANGTIYYLECNPRFFYKMDLAMLAGINFARFGLWGNTTDIATSVPSGTSVKLPQALVRSLVRPWRLTRKDFKMMKYILADPIALLMERLGLQ